MTTHNDDAPACPACNGTGRYRDPRYWGTMPGSTACEHCDGSGIASRPSSTWRTSGSVRPTPDDFDDR